MNSLFKRIHSLLRCGYNSAYEDLLTEVFADIFLEEKMIVDFLNIFLKEEIEKPIDVKVSTQKTFLKKKGHEVDSRPDLVLSFKDVNHKYFIMFENKLDTGEGVNQLSRYADHLRTFKNNNFKTFLFYITKYDDPKKTEDILKGEKEICFIQLRWYEVYCWLKTQSDTYVEKIIEFMEVLGLDQTRKFLPQDMYAIQEMNRLQRMMDECLDGELDEVMKELFGAASGWTNRNVQLRNHNRYFKANDQSNWQAWVGCGFIVTKDEYPLVSVIYEVSPKNDGRKEVTKAIVEFLKDRSDWESYNLNQDSEWAGLRCDKSLLDFLKDEDHISSVQKFFIEKLNELALFKQNNPHLNWKI